MIAVSGEIHFNLTNISRQWSSKSSNLGDLKLFLDQDVTFNSTANSSTSKIASFTETYVNTLKHWLLLWQNCEFEQERQLRRVREAISRIETKNFEANDAAESKLMNCVLSYFDILRQELFQTRQRLQQENLVNAVLRQQAKEMRNIKLFAKCAEIESSGKVLLTVLQQDSSQFARCTKAVVDNMEGDFLRLRNFDELKVSNVMKLEHAHLAQNLKNSVTTVENGNIKGLFCVIPSGGLFPLVAYGLHVQDCLYRDPLDVKNNLPSWYHTPWFDAQRNQQGTAQFLSKCPSISHVYFSKYSTSPSFSQFTREDLEAGVCIALCRVLISRVKSVSVSGGSSLSAVIAQAVKGDYDAVFNQTTEQYVLLKPSFVLPEFIMQMRFTGTGTGTGMQSTAAKPAAVQDCVARHAMLQQSARNVASHFMNHHSKAAAAAAAAGGGDDMGSRLSSGCMGRGLGERLLANEEEQSRRIAAAGSDHRTTEDTFTGRAALLHKQTLVLMIEEACQDFHLQLNGAVINQVKQI